MLGPGSSLRRAVVHSVEFSGFPATGPVSRRRLQTQWSAAAAPSKSFAVSPPSLWVENDSVTRL